MGTSTRREEGRNGREWGAGRRGELERVVGEGRFIGDAKRGRLR